MKEFEALVSRTHKAGLKMFIDFVPNHVARQYLSIAKPKGVVDLGADDDKNQGFNPQNNFYYCPGCKLETPQPSDYEECPAKATGNDHFDNRPGMNDWYETVKLNYGIDYWTHYGHFDPIPDTWKKMTEILLFWAAKGVDGFRCDMAEMVPAAFWAYATREVKAKYPKILFMGEVYNPAEYGCMTRWECMTLCEPLPADLPLQHPLQVHGKRLTTSRITWFISLRITMNSVWHPISLPVMRRREYLQW